MPVQAQTTVRIDLSVADGRGGTATGFVNVAVVAIGSAHQHRAQRDRHRVE